VQNEGFRLAVCCGHQDGDDDEFVCFTDPSTPLVKKFFKKIDATAQLSRLVEAMEQILSSDPEIKGSDMERADLATNFHFEKFRARNVPAWNARLLT
jgi:trehalose-6-phosphatase